MKKRYFVFFVFLLVNCASSKEAVVKPSSSPPSATPSVQDKEEANTTTIISKHQQGALPSNVRPTSDDEIVKLLDKKATFALLYNSDICGAGRLIWGELNDYDGPWPLLVLNEHYKGSSTMELSPQTEKILNGKERATPTLFLFKKGILIDQTSTLSKSDGLERFVKRNTSSSAGRIYNQKAKEWTPAKRRKILLYGSTFFYIDLSGVNLKGLILKRKSFEGSDLRNASFKNSTLEAINFSHANLQGADFQGASLNKVFWGSCICPDGTRSAENSYSCDHHLSPKRSPQVVTDSDPNPDNEPAVRNNLMLSEIEDAHHSGE